MCVTNTLHRRNPVTFPLHSLKTTNAFQPVAPLDGHQPPSSSLQQPFFVLSAPEPKRRPKRIRKPQKPGKTAKNQERHFVVHNYHDHALECSESEEDELAFHNNEATSHDGKIHFPLKLHQVLDEVVLEGLNHIISWSVHGRCFVIHDPKEFTHSVMPKYFRQSKLTSFQRQLNLYGFQRITRGRDAGGYYNEYFLRGKPSLCSHMTRVKVKGTRYKAASNPEEEPNFYKMPFVSFGYVPKGMMIEPTSVYPIGQPSSDLPFHRPAVQGLVSPSSSDSSEGPLPLSSQHFDIFDPLPLNETGDLWQQSPLDQSESELAPEIAEFCDSWAEEGEGQDKFEETLASDDSLTFMIEKLLED